MKCVRILFCVGLLATQLQGELLISDRATNQILRYDEVSGDLIDVLVGGDPAANGGLVGPSALTLGPNNELLAASQFTGQVLRYDLETGQYLGAFASQLNGPAGLLYDSARDRLYVSTLGNFDSELVMLFRASTAEPLGAFGAGTGASGRTSMTYGPDGQFYVSSFANDEFFSGSVLGFDTETLEPLGTLAATPGLAGANDLVFRDTEAANEFTLDVVGLFSSTVARFDVGLDAAGKLTSDAGQLLITSGLDFPSAILDLQDGSLLVSSLGNDNPQTGDLRPGSVNRFDASTGELLGTFIAAGGPGNLSQPTDMLLLSTNMLDCNGDGVVDIRDTDCATPESLGDILAAAGLTQGDADGNGAVDFEDFLVLSNNFGQEGAYTEGDFDLLDDIGFADFLILSNNFSQGSVAAAVPEPSSGALVLMGCVALLRPRRRSGSTLRR